MEICSLQSRPHVSPLGYMPSQQQPRKLIKLHSKRIYRMNMKKTKSLVNLCTLPPSSTLNEKMYNELQTKLHRHASRLRPRSQQTDHTSRLPMPRSSQACCASRSRMCPQRAAHPRALGTCCNTTTAETACCQSAATTTTSTPDHSWIFTTADEQQRWVLSCLLPCLVI